MENKIFRIYTLSSSDEPNRVRYVGVTQNSIERRFQGHKGKARGKNPTQPVHKWMQNKYKLNCDIICTEIDCCCESEWEEKEKYWIAYYRKLEPELLNLQTGGTGIITAEMRSVDGMERTRLASIRPVASCDENFNIIKEFESLTEAAKYYNISKGNIWIALNNSKRSCGGYKWIYLEKQINLEEHAIKRDPNYNKRIIVYKFDKDNNLVQTYQSMRAVMRDVKGYNSNQSGDYFKKHILNQNKLWESYYWSTNKDFIIQDNDFVLKEVTPSGEIIDKFKYKTHAAKKFNVSVDVINYRLEKHKPLSNGNFIEKY